MVITFRQSGLFGSSGTSQRGSFFGFDLNVGLKPYTVPTDYARRDYLAGATINTNVKQGAMPARS